jgi:hypothetical protein
MKKRFVVVGIIVSLLFPLLSPAFAAQVSAKNEKKPTPLVGLAEVQIVNSPVDSSMDVQIKLYKSNSYTARVKVGENFQLLVTGLRPNLVSLPVLVSPVGMSVNLTSSVPDLDGIITLPNLRIMKKGNYTLIIRQPEATKAVMAKIKVS